MVCTGPGGVFKQTFPLYEIEVKKDFNYEKFADKAASILGMKLEIPIFLQPSLEPRLSSSFSPLAVRKSGEKLDESLGSSLPPAYVRVMKLL